VTEPLLEVRDLVVRFTTDEGDLTAVDGVSFSVPRGCTFALVGESGCGKTVTAHAIMGLLPTPPARIDAGQVRFEGRELLGLAPRELRRIRGARLAMVFQDPLAALHPLYTVGAQLSEAFRLHLPLGRGEAKRRALELFERVGLPEPALRFDDYPHELSGGMRQRVMIAMAMACQPSLIIADEPTTALDLLAAAEITALLARLRAEHDTSLLLISHDLGMVADIADRVAVLYAGQVVELGTSADVLGEPRHPYTAGLLRSVPPRRGRQRRRRVTPTRLRAIPGSLPDPHRLPAGCRFADRCVFAIARCRAEAPELRRFPGAGAEPVLARCLRLDETGRLPASAIQAPASPSTEAEP
jgi:oligopeptide/dipeptide ABC transporter ATP-binding protein